MSCAYEHTAENVARSYTHLTPPKDTAPPPMQTDCFGTAAQPLGQHPAAHDASSHAFANRYTAPPAPTQRTTFTARVSPSTVVGGGAPRRARRARRSRARSRSRTTTRRTLARGGGYFLDLSSCPPGGMPSPVGYDDRRPPLVTMGGGTRHRRRRRTTNHRNKKTKTCRKRR